MISLSYCSGQKQDGEENDGKNSAETVKQIELRAANSPRRRESLSDTRPDVQSRENSGTKNEDSGEKLKIDGHDLTVSAEC